MSPDFASQYCASLGKALPSLGLRLPSAQGRDGEASLQGPLWFGSFMVPETLPSALLCVCQSVWGWGVSTQLSTLRGGQSARVSPSPTTQYLELLLHQERKNHYLQMTSLCKNASGWLLCRTLGKGQEERAQSLLTPGRSGIQHL